MGKWWFVTRRWLAGPRKEEEQERKEEKEEGRKEKGEGKEEEEREEEKDVNKMAAFPRVKRSAMWRERKQRGPRGWVLLMISVVHTHASKTKRWWESFRAYNCWCVYICMRLRVGVCACTFW